jgi:hypothetical protein
LRDFECIKNLPVNINYVFQLVLVVSDQVKIIFGISSRSVRLYRSKDKKQEVTELPGDSVLNLHAAMLFADVVN